MKSEYRILAAAAAGLGVGFLLATFSAGQYVATQTALLNQDRDEANADHAAQVKAVIDRAADTLEALRVERDEALAQLEVLKPKAVGGEDATA